MNTIVYIALSILFFGCTFACGYCCAMTKVCKNMKEILELIDAITLIRKSRGADIIFKDPKIRLGYVAGYDDGKIDAEREKMRKEETK